MNRLNHKYKPVLLLRVFDLENLLPTRVSLGPISTFLIIYTDFQL
jgi:hypothetical protein